jgi:flagellar assembly factor FliW
MQAVDTKFFEKIPYEPDAEIAFPWGLPAFEQRRKFVLIRFPNTGPLFFLQSLDERDLCFPVIRTLLVDPQYRLRIEREDLRRLELPLSRQPRYGEEVECLALVTLRESGATANLRAPVVLNLRKMLAIQAVGSEPYSLQHPLKLPQKAGSCS